MKRIICLITTLCLVFGSFSFVFAEVSNSQASQIVSDLSTIKTTLSNIYSRVNTITNYLYDDSHSIAYWTSAIASWMQPIYSALTSNLSANLGLDIIEGLLGYPQSVSGGGTTWIPYLKNIYDLQNYDGNLQYFKNVGTLYRLQYTGSGNSNQPTFPLNSASIEGHMLSFMTALNGSFVNYAVDTWNNFQHITTGYNATQNALSWSDLDSTYTFTPASSTDGLYKWLATIQAPVARLSYVLASDERIEAQELAAANEQAVVDNFIDPNGAGSASTSDIGSVSDLSSGFSSNISTDADPGDIFDIFDSNNFSWFSQEVADSLDTTNSNNRSKSGSEFETPLLDQRIDDIYDALGVKHD